MSPHRAILTAFVKRQRWASGAELGVQKGILFEMLLDGCPDLRRLIGVDIFVDDHHHLKCEQAVERSGGRASIMKMTTREASTLLPDGTLDFVFIDADHSYQAVKDDIACWAPKVKAGGWVGGHDYNRKFPGVVQAVREVAGDPAPLGLRDLHFLDGSIWGMTRC